MKTLHPFSTKFSQVDCSAQQRIAAGLKLSTPSFPYSAPVLSSASYIINFLWGATGLVQGSHSLSFLRASASRLSYQPALLPILATGKCDGQIA